MDDDGQDKKLAENCEKTLRMFLPGDCPETRYAKPVGPDIIMPAPDFYAKIVGMAQGMGSDVRNSVADGIAALEVARKAGLNQIEMLGLEARCKKND